VVRRYSTSFSRGIRALHPRFRPHIRAIYGFVRVADEIVDSFHGHDRKALLQRFRADTCRALEEGISLNPVLHAFQRTARAHGIDRKLVEPFLDSMAMDLERSHHDPATLLTYIHGSAEAVGLMCLRVFCAGDESACTRLGPSAMRLGAALQKINFLRDLRDDHARLGRNYFPLVKPGGLDEAAKQGIEHDIEADLQAARQGIAALPRDARFGVYIAYAHHVALFRKIQGLSAAEVLQKRVRLGWQARLRLIGSAFLRHGTGRI
jgi:phytoene/squalene synthetase